MRALRAVLAIPVQAVTIIVAFVTLACLAVALGFSMASDAIGGDRS